MPKVVLELLDPARGHPLQTWTFDQKESIQLGRADNNDVVVTDPHVSRSHAYLSWTGSHWLLISISQQKVIHNDQTYQELNLSDGVIFRLGPNGCFLRFCESQTETSELKTVSFDFQAMPIFLLDRDKMQREVSQITDGQYFQRVKDVAQQLRQRRSLEETTL